MAPTSTLPPAGESEWPRSPQLLKTRIPQGASGLPLQNAFSCWSWGKGEAKNGEREGVGREGEIEKTEKRASQNEKGLSIIKGGRGQTLRGDLFSFQDSSTKSVVLTLKHEPRPPGGFAKSQVAKYHPSVHHGPGRPHFENFCSTAFCQWRDGREDTPTSCETGMQSLWQRQRVFNMEVWLSFGWGKIASLYPQEHYESSGGGRGETETILRAYSTPSGVREAHANTPVPGKNRSPETAVLDKALLQPSAKGGSLPLNLTVSSLWSPGGQEECGRTCSKL